MAADRHRDRAAPVRVPTAAAMPAPLRDRAK